MYAFSLTREEERQLTPLAKRCLLRHNDIPPRQERDAVNRLTQSVGGIVMQKAKEIGANIPDYIDDLFQEGMMTATKSIRWFDPDRGIKFITYASNSAIRQMLFKREKYFEKKYFFDNEELAEEGSEVYDPVPTGDAVGLLDLIQEDESSVRYIKLHFGIGCASLTMKDIARRDGVSPQLVSSYVNKGLKKIRSRMKAAEAAEVYC